MSAANKTMPEGNGIFKEGDVVWIKIRNIYWPATVTKVIKRCKKAAVKLLHTQSRRKAYTKSFKDLIDFKNNKRNKKLLNTGKKQNSEVEEAYRKAIEIFDKRDNDGNLASSSRDSNSDKDVHRIERLISEFGKAASDSEDEDDQPGEFNMADSTVKEDSPDGQKVIEQVKKPSCLRYLKSIFQGRSPSERHKIFMKGSWSERSSLKFGSGVGPLNDNQVHEVYKILTGYFPKIAPKGTVDNPSSYIFDVLLPEAIIFALQNIHGFEKQEAEKAFTETTLSSWNLQKRHVESQEK